jgi:hypothetical protein
MISFTPPPVKSEETLQKGINPMSERKLGSSALAIIA